MIGNKVKSSTEVIFPKLKKVRPSLCTPSNNHSSSANSFLTIDNHNTGKLESNERKDIVSNERRAKSISTKH